MAPVQVGLRNRLHEIVGLFLLGVTFVGSSSESDIHFDIWAFGREPNLLSMPNLRNKISEADFNFRTCQRLCTLAARRISAISPLKFCLVPVSHDWISHRFRREGQRSATEFLRPCVNGWQSLFSLSSHLSSPRNSDDRRPTGPPCSLQMQQPHRVSLQDAARSTAWKLNCSTTALGYSMSLALKLSVPTTMRSAPTRLIRKRSPSG